MATGIVASLHQRRHTACIHFVWHGTTWELGTSVRANAQHRLTLALQYPRHQYLRHSTSITLQPVCAQLLRSKKRRVIDGLLKASVHIAHARILEADSFIRLASSVGATNQRCRGEDQCQGEVTNWGSADK